LSEPPAGPSDLAVSISYEITLEDLREALQSPPINQQQRDARDRKVARESGVEPPSKSRIAARFSKGGFLGWFLFVGLAVMLIILLNKTQGRAQPAPPDQPQAIDVWLSVGPSALGASGLAVFILTVTVFAWMSNRKGAAPKPPGTPSKVIVVGLMASLGLVALAFWFMLHPPVTLDWHPTRGQAALWVMFPWIAVFVLMWVTLRIAARRGTRAMYEGNPAFRRPHAMRIDAQGIQVDDGVSMTLYRWPCFNRAWESENLLVLDDESRRRHFIPKRALLATGQLEAARALIVTHVKETDLFVAPGAFPVHRPAGAAPIPAIPIGDSSHGGRV
jgi:hypothetical protein